MGNKETFRNLRDHLYNYFGQLLIHLLPNHPTAEMSDFAAKKTEEEEVPKVEKTEEGEDDGDDEGPAPVSIMLIY